MKRRYVNEQGQKQPAAEDHSLFICVLNHIPQFPQARLPIRPIGSHCNAFATSREPFVAIPLVLEST